MECQGILGHTMRQPGAHLEHFAAATAADNLELGVADTLQSTKQTSGGIKQII